LRGLAKPGPGLATAATMVGVPGVPPAVPDAAVVISPLPPSAPAPIVVVQRRSVVWPVLAGAMLAVTAGALYLVWQEMQTQRGATVQIETGPDHQVQIDDANVITIGRPDPTSPAPSPAPPPVTEPTDKPTDKHHTGPTSNPTHKVMPHPVDPNAPYKHVIVAKLPEVRRCVADHGDLPSGTKLEIQIAPDGHPRDTTFDPVSVGATPLGTCIKKVFRGVVFPHADKDIFVPVAITQGA
jgi:hypothetical protein